MKKVISILAFALLLIGCTKEEVSEGTNCGCGNVNRIFRPSMQMPIFVYYYSCNGKEYQIITSDIYKIGQIICH